jgi:hypothetical protein
MQKRRKKAPQTARREAIKEGTNEMNLQFKFIISIERVDVYILIAHKIIRMMVK